MTTTLLVPTLNEIESIVRVMPQIDRAWCEQILIVDGGSTDGTVEWARDQGYEVLVQRGTGLRQAYQEALPHCRGDIVITFSPDGNSVPDRIPPLIEKMREGFDMVIVSRYLPPAKSADDDVVTAFGNWFFTTSVNVLFGGQYTDVMVMYRAFKRDILKRLDLEGDGPFAGPERVLHTKLGMEPLLSARAAKRKLKVGEIPGDAPPRIGGQRKLQIVRWGLGHVYQFAVERLSSD